MSLEFDTAFGTLPYVLIIDSIRVLGGDFDSPVMEGLGAFARPILGLEPDNELNH